MDIISYSIHTTFDVLIEQHINDHYEKVKPVAITTPRFTPKKKKIQ